MVTSGRTGRTHFVQDAVLVRRVRRGQIRQRGQGGVPLGADRRFLVAERAPSTCELRQLLALLRRRRPLSPTGGAILLGAQLFELGGEGAPALVEFEQPVD